MNRRKRYPTDMLRQPNRRATFSPSFFATTLQREGTPEAQWEAAPSGGEKTHFLERSLRILKIASLASFIFQNIIKNIFVVIFFIN